MVLQGWDVRTFAFCKWRGYAGKYETGTPSSTTITIDGNSKVNFNITPSTACSPLTPVTVEPYLTSQKFSLRPTSATADYASNSVIYSYDVPAKLNGNFNVYDGGVAYRVNGNSLLLLKVRVKLDGSGIFIDTENSAVRAQPTSLTRVDTNKTCVYLSYNQLNSYIKGTIAISYSGGSTFSQNFEFTK